MVVFMYTDITLAYTLCNVITSSRNKVSHYSTGETLVEGILMLYINKERMHQALVYCGRCNVGTPSPLGLSFAQGDLENVHALLIYTQHIKCNHSSYHKSHLSKLA